MTSILGFLFAFSFAVYISVLLFSWLFERKKFSKSLRQPGTIYISGVSLCLLMAFMYSKNFDQAKQTLDVYPMKSQVLNAKIDKEYAALMSSKTYDVERTRNFTKLFSDLDALKTRRDFACKKVKQHPACID